MYFSGVLKLVSTMVDPTGSKPVCPLSTRLSGLNNPALALSQLLGRVV
jgi:hypothetical protein